MRSLLAVSGILLGVAAILTATTGAAEHSLARTRRLAAETARRTDTPVAKGSGAARWRGRFPRDSGRPPPAAPTNGTNGLEGTRVRRVIDARRMASVAVGTLASLIVGGVPGVALGIAAAALAGRLLGRIPDEAERRRRDHLLADLPIGLDLLASSLTAGAPLAIALDTAAQALRGPVGDEFAVVAQALRLGAGPDQACRRLCAPGVPPALAAVARAFGRADESGSRLAVQLRALADAERAAAHARALEAARRVGVMAVAPLGACFLPAFVLLGVVPVAASAARHVLS